MRRTPHAVLSPLNNAYGQWMDFFQEAALARWTNRKPVVKFESQPGLTPKHPPMAP